MATSTTKKPPAKKKSVLSEGEMEALQDTLRERKKGGKADGLADVLAAIDKLTGVDRKIAEGLHELVTTAAPQLKPKTWYGMPAYANDKEKVVCFFKPAGKFKTRYATFGFEEAAKLDDGNMWITSFAVTTLDDADKKKLTALVKKAVG